MNKIVSLAALASCTLLVLSMAPAPTAVAYSPSYIWCTAYSSGHDSPRRIYYSRIYEGDYGANSQRHALAFERHLERRHGYAEVGGCYFAYPLERAREENRQMREKDELAGYDVVLTGWAPES